MSKVAAVFPGQGSQTVGMGVDFLAEDEGLAEWFNGVCSQMNLDLRSLIENGPAEKLQETRITQPAVFLVNQLIFKFLRKNFKFEPDFYAGHSLGEYNALASSEWSDFKTLFPVVEERGQAMGEAADRVNGGMAALLRIDVEAAEELCRNVSDDSSVEGTVQVALYNSPDQIVISGANSALDVAVDRAKDAGALKAVKLDVSGPWHSRYMEPAVAPLQDVLESVKWNEGGPVVTNVSADFLERSPMDGLIKQLTQPVRWTQSIRRLLDQGVRTFVEVGPGDALKGMIERIVKSTNYDVEVYETDNLENTRDVMGAMSV